MRRVGTVLGLVGLLGMGSGCAMVASPVGNAFLTDLKGPWVPGPSTTVTKQGRACATNLLGIVANGDASIEAAKKSGGIKKVATVDHHSRNFLGLYSEFCTIVSGS